MSIRFRFTLLYNAILAVTLTIFGMALYTIQSNSTLQAIKKEINRSSETLGASVLRTVMGENGSQAPQKNPDSNLSTAPSIPANPEISNSQGEPIPPDNFPPPKPFSSFSSDQAFQRLPEREIVRVADADGNLVASPYGRKEDALPLSQDALDSLKNGREYWETASVQNQDMLIYDRPITKNGQVQYILQVARPLTERNHSLQVLGNTLVLATVFTLVIAFGIGWVFSGITLQPIQRITRTARTIGQERDFSKRVDYTGPQDEVGELAVTFNSMLSRLQDAYQKVAKSLSQQRDFVADVSHELRTPLTTLRGNLGLLVRVPPIPEEEQKDIINDMVMESDRMIRLVNELLRLAHADAGRNLKRERFNLTPLVEECSRQIQTLDITRSVTWNCPDDLCIVGDKDAFRQVLLILLDNAIKHSSGSITITGSRSGEKVLVEVRDDGEGIPKEKLDRVFDRFFRADEEKSSNGFGLGLPIARSLVEAQGGNIRIESAEGKGCQVFLDFMNN